MSEKDSIQYGTTTITYNVTYRKRKTASIKVHPTNEVEAVVPLGTKREKVWEMMKTGRPGYRRT